MGLATIDPHSQKEHTEIHKIPMVGVNQARLTEIHRFKNVKINKEMYDHLGTVSGRLTVRHYSQFLCLYSSC